MINKLLRHGMHYASSSLLISIAGLISFPILTRALPIEEYGILSLLTTILGLFVALNKFGLQQSVLRFYSNELEEFQSSLFFIFIANSLCLSFFYLISIVLIQYLHPDAIPVKYFIPLYMSSILQSYKSIVINCFASDQKTIFVGLFHVFQKYTAVLMMLICIALVEGDAMSILYSILIADFITVFVITIPWFRTFTWHRYNPNLIKKIMLYGAPLMVVEFMQIAHAFIDRFLINYFKGAEHVALYSAPYSIAEIISAILLGSVSTALVPIYMGLWNSGEKERTAEFLSTVSDYFLLFFPVFIMGSYIVSGPVMNILASDKYSDSAYILPIALTGLLVFSSTFIYSAGLKFKKSQNKVMQYVFESLILNVFLNIVFIEPFGIVASAWSTVVSYLWMSIRYYYASKEILKIDINIGYLFRGLIIAMIVYLCIYLLGFDENNITDLLVNLFSSVIIGLLLFYLLDGVIQKKVNELVSNSLR